MSVELSRPASASDAAELAARGDYDAAMTTLRELGGSHSENVVVLDLLARVHAQRREYLDADACWARAQRIDGEFAPALEGRRRVAALVERGARPRTGRTLLATLVVAGVVGAAAYAGALLAPDPATPDDPRLSATLAQLDQMRRDQQAQGSRLADMGGQLDDAVLRDHQTLDRIGAALADAPHFTARTNTEGIVVTFREGLFNRGATLLSDGREALTELANRLPAEGRESAITVVGHTDGSPPTARGGYDDNDELGLARAAAAAKRLAEGTGLPLSAFAQASAGDGNTPYPNATQRDRLDNRTVTVRIRPR